MGQIRLAIICDYREEKWQSMDLCAQMLLQYLSEENTSIQAVQICPTFKTRLQKIPFLGKKRFAYNADRLINRFWDYPHYLKQQVKNFDFYHIVDHTYAQLAHVLPPERTGVYCHDLDAFRSLLEPAQEPRPSWYRAMSRRILQGFQSVAVVFYSTLEVKKQIEHYQLIESSRLVQASLGIAPEFTITSDPIQIEEIGEDPFLLHVGSCIPRKRIDILLEVFAQLQAIYPKLRLVKVSGEWTASQQEQIIKLNIPNSIIHLQDLPRSTIASLYRKASAVLLTSEAEGFGLPLVEALACGALVVASDIDVLKEVGGQGAVYCPLTDVSAWVKTIDSLLSDLTTTHALSLRLSQAQKYSWSHHAQIIAQTYLKLAGYYSDENSIC